MADGEAGPTTHLACECLVLTPAINNIPTDKPRSVLTQFASLEASGTAALDAMTTT
jgi:hypothetical protein